MAIIGLFATIAWHAYQPYADRARRAEGRAALLQVLLQQERHFTRQQRYQAFSTTVPDARFRAFSGPSRERSAYLLTAGPCPGADLRSCVRVTATPRQWRDAQCGALWMESRGQRGADGEGTCW